jgi:hypothetical protein
MTQLTTEQIDVLARFDGWEKQKHSDQTQEWETWRKGFKFIPVDGIAKHLTSTATLIEMRLKLKEKGKSIDEFSLRLDVLSMVDHIGELILSGDYTAAAINTFEIIKKLEA